MLPVLTKKPSLRSMMGIATETIDFQNDNFGVELEAICTVIQKKILEGNPSHSAVSQFPELTEMTKLIFDRLGLKVDIVTDSMPAAIMPFYSNKNHIFIDEFWRGNFSIREQDKILRQANGKKGTVNTAKARVGGLFSEYENILYVNFINLFKSLKVSAPEMAAIILHELGHAFYACEYADRLESTNQVLANVARELSSTRETKDMVYIFRELEKVNPKITEQEVDNLVNGNKVIAGYTWFRTIVGTVKSQMESTKYSETSFEQMADNFAARFKYGRQLITGLDKLHRAYGYPETSRPMIVFYNIMQTLTFMAYVGATVASVMFAMIPAAFLFAILSFVLLRTQGDDMRDYTYDELKVRYKRTRNEYVELLKNAKLPDEVVKTTLADLERMDRAVNSVHKFEPLLRVIANFIFADAKAADRAIREQQLLEELAFNDLFIKSAEFRTM